MIQRRGFLGSILAAGMAPAFVGAKVLMPVRAIAMPAWTYDELVNEAARKLAEKMDHDVTGAAFFDPRDNWYHFSTLSDVNREALAVGRTIHITWPQRFVMPLRILTAGV